MPFICGERSLLIREYQAAQQHHYQLISEALNKAGVSCSSCISEIQPKLKAALYRLEMTKFALEMHCACHRCQISFYPFCECQAWEPDCALVQEIA